MAPIIPTVSAVQLANEASWDTLIEHVHATNTPANEMDDFGMTALHWACTDKHVPLNVILTLLLSWPEGALHFNRGGLLPLHIAIKTKAPLSILRQLIEVSPESIQPTKQGKSILDLAEMYQCNEECLAYLRSQGVAARTRPLAILYRKEDITIKEEDTVIEEKTEIIPLFRKDNQSEEAATLSDFSSEDIADAIFVPPEWKQTERCHICLRKFSYVNPRHHCRQCGQSTCGAHSSTKMELKQMGLHGLQRVCVLCYSKSHLDDDVDVPKSAVPRRQSANDIFTRRPSLFTRKNSFFSAVPRRKSGMFQDRGDSSLSGKPPFYESAARTSTASLPSENNVHKSQNPQDKVQQALNTGNHRGAIAALNAAIAIDELDADLWVSLGRVHYTLKEYTEAEKAVRTALWINGRTAIAEILLRKILDEKKRHSLPCTLEKVILYPEN